MKKSIVVMLAVFMGTQAWADGFRCQSIDGDLNVSVFNHTQPEIGTRVGAVMVLSDPSVKAGRKTIARFTGVNGTLASDSLTYIAKVDLRFKDSRRKGELLAGTRLGQLAEIQLDVDGFTYLQPIADGDLVSGTLSLTKRSGDIIEVAMDCVRYLKN